MKLLSTLILILCSLTLFGQKKYIPFPESDVVWVVNEDDEHGNLKSGYNWFNFRDTVVGTVTYHMFAMSFYSSLELWPNYIWYGIRNDTVNKRVYVFDPVAQKESLLYDFSLKMGDTIPKSFGGIDRYESRIVTDIDTLFIDNIAHQVFEVDNNLVSPYIEEIGSLSGPFDESVYFFEGGTTLICQLLGNKTNYNRNPGPCELYHSTGIDDKLSVKNEIIVYPNPINKYSVIECSSERDKMEHIEIYNILGKKIVDETNLGIYFPVGKRIKSPGLYSAVVHTQRGSISVLKIIKD